MLISSCALNIVASEFQITSYEDLKLLSTQVCPLDGSYRLTQNIDASLSGSENSSNGAGMRSIGSDTNNFSGQFHGAGHVIDALNINDTTDIYVGLFGAIGTGATVDSLGLTHANITNSVSVAGAYGAIPKSGLLAGGNWGSITSCFANGNLDAELVTYSTLGGLVGLNYGTLSNSYVTGTITGGTSAYVGGLVGDNESTINNSYAMGHLVGGSGATMGGLVASSYGPAALMHK